MGIAKCRASAYSAVYWPGISKDTDKLEHKLTTCIQEAKDPSELFKPANFPQRLWKMVAMDLFKLHSDWYLLVTDYYSHYP